MGRRAGWGRGLTSRPMVHHRPAVAWRHMAQAGRRLPSPASLINGFSISAEWESWGFGRQFINQRQPGTAQSGNLSPVSGPRPPSTDRRRWSADLIWQKPETTTKPGEPPLSLLAPRSPSVLLACLCRRQGRQPRARAWLAGDPPLSSVELQLRPTHTAPSKPTPSSRFKPRIAARPGSMR